MNGAVLVITNFIAGLHSFRKEVIKAIIDEGYDIYISVPDSEDERVRYFEEIGCHIIKTEFDRRGMNPFSDLRLLLNYCKIIRKIRPKAVLTYTIKPNVYGGIACRLTSVPQLANVTGLGDALENGGWLQKLTAFLYRQGVKNAMCTFFQNSANRDFCISQKIFGKKLIVLPGSGVNLKYHAFQEYPPDGTVKFLYISRLLKDKGVDEFFEMAEIIKERYPNTEFQILGWIEGDYKDRLNELARRNVVSHLGATSDVRPYLGEVHCTIMPSYHEGMSNVNLESAANGRPVITTNVPGCRETVDDGRTGFLVEPRNSKSLINAVERFILLPYNQKKMMGKNARYKVEREFDRNIVVTVYLNELSNIC